MIMRFSGTIHKVATLMLGLAVAVPAGFASAQGAMNVAPSGRATTAVELTFADSATRAKTKPAAIRIDYGQPHLRGRSLHTETLVPYDKVWRLGANGATTLSTDVDIMIGGMAVPKGMYVLQAMPGKAGWKLFVQKVVNVASLADNVAYDPANDVARVDLTVNTTPTPLESLTITLVPSTKPGPAHGDLHIGWGTTVLTTTWTTK